MFFVKNVRRGISQNSIRSTGTVIGVGAVLSLLSFGVAVAPVHAQDTYQYKFALGRPVLNFPFSSTSDAVGNIYIGCIDGVIKLDSAGNFLGKIGGTGSANGQFNGVGGLTVDSLGNLYATDQGNHRVQKFDKNGKFLLAFGTNGSENGQFRYPFGIKIDSAGFIWVSDSGNHRLQRFNKSGVYISQFGSTASGPGSLFNPSGFCFDLTGNFLVADSFLDRVIKFDPKGNYLGRMNLFVPEDVVVDALGNIFVTTGTQKRVFVYDKNGVAAGTITPKINPITLSLTPNATLLLCDPTTGLVQEVTTTGANVRQFGQANVNDPGNFNHPYSLSLDAKENIYVLDENLGTVGGMGRVSKFSPTGSLLSTFTGTQIGCSLDNRPAGIALDGTGNLFGTGNDTVRKFDSVGTFLGSIGGTGTTQGFFSSCTGVAVDSTGNVLVADTKNNRVQRFDKTGKFLSKFGVLGTYNGQFKEPVGIALDALGNIHVTDTGNNRIQVFDQNGVFRFKFGTPGNANGQFNTPTGIAVDTIGNIYVADSGNNRIQKFDNKGTFITSLTNYPWGTTPISEPHGVGVNAFGDVFITDYSGASVLALTPVSGLPSLTSLSPAQTFIGTTDLNILVNGTKFGANTKVKFSVNGQTTDLKTVYVSPTQVTVTIPTALMKTAGVASVTASNPAPGGGTSNVRNFTIANPRPLVTTLSPAKVVMKSPATMVTVNGSNFLPTSVVNFGTTVLPTTYVSSTQLSVTLPTTLLLAPAVVPVTVTTPGPGIGVSNAVNFTVGNPVPTITNLLPSSIPVGSAETEVQVLGTGFVNTSQVYLNGVAQPTTLVGARLAFKVPASLLTSGVGISVTVVNAAPGGGTSLPFTLRVVGATTLTVPTQTATLTKTADGLVVSVYLKNTGTATAWDVRTIAAKLNTTATATVLPISTASIVAGASTKLTFTFPLTAAASGTTPTLKFSYTSLNGGSGSASVPCAKVP